MPDALLHAVRRDRESEPTGERRAARQAELAQPCTRDRSGQRVEQHLQHVPARDETEHRTERPEREAVRPARVVRLRLRLGAKRVWVAPRRAPVLELVPDEPVVVERLQMVAGGRLTVPRRSTR